jgi:hypothetical protein
MVLQRFFMMKRQRYSNIGAALAAALVVAVSACSTTVPAHHKLSTPPSDVGGSGKSTDTIAPPAQMVADRQPAPWIGPRPGQPDGAAAPDSVEGRLRADGLKWEMAPGQVKAGGYVKDILQGRLDQPEGRGEIGKVTSVDEFIGLEHAWVDFGRNCVEHIRTSELSPIRMVEPATPYLR